jgi:hypothetical protein
MHLTPGFTPHLQPYPSAARPVLKHIILYQTHLFYNIVLFTLNKVEKNVIVIP